MKSWSSLLGALMLLGAAQSQALMPVKVALVGEAPFVMPLAGDRYAGLSVELMNIIAPSLDIITSFTVTSEVKALLGLSDGTFDLAIGDISLASQYQAYDVSIPYLISGLAIAISSLRPPEYRALFDHLASVEFIQPVAILLGLLSLFSLLMWLAERKVNPEYEGSFIEGAGFALWWSFLMMTTIGESRPCTRNGKFIAVGWLIIVILSISGLLGSVSSALTASRLNLANFSTRDLKQVTVGVINNSAGHEYAIKNFLDFNSYAQLGDALKALDEQEISAIVDEETTLKYLKKSTPQAAILVTDSVFFLDLKTIVLNRNSPYRDKINEAIYQLVKSPQWLAILHKYLGRMPLYHS